jgi:hypothetical protein
LVGIEDDEVAGNAEKATENHPVTQLPAFSGAFTSSQVRDVFETEMEHENSSDRDGTSTIFEETESISVGEVMKSPVFSEDESSDNSFWIDLGQSPLGSDSASQNWPLHYHLSGFLERRTTPDSPQNQHPKYMAAQCMMTKG